METKAGNELHPDDRKHVLAAYVHRMTTETRRRFPDFTRRMLDGGYRMPERSDTEWLAATEFVVRGDGRLDARYKYCHTS